nr:L-rhamnose mutarotase [Bacteroidota bacterium]
MKRFTQLINVKPEKLEVYKKLHANPWPCVIKKIKECNIRNYTISLTPDYQLFAYFEYTGENFEQDMKKMAADECTQKWWKETAPCQERLTDDPDEWWLNLEEVFHLD